jgi:hypothetical protein
MAAKSPEAKLRQIQRDKARTTRIREEQIGRVWERKNTPRKIATACNKHLLDLIKRGHAS